MAVNNENQLSYSQLKVKVFAAVLNLSGVLLSTLEKALTRTTNTAQTKVTSSKSSSKLQLQMTSEYSKVHSYDNKVEHKQSRHLP